MRRTSAILAALLVVAACGGGDDTGAVTTDTTEPLEGVVVTEPGTDTTIRRTDNTTLPTTVATTTTEAETYPGLEEAMAAAGTYTGTWTNTTFGSTGEATMTMTVTEDGDVTMEWDLGGFVFGASDPDGETQTLNVADLIGGRVIQSELFGEIEIDVSADFTTLMMTADAVPTPGIEAFLATATWSDDGTISGTYVVEFGGGSEPAEGEFEMTRG